MKFYFTALVLFVTLYTFSQAKETLKGTVVEESSGKTFPGANVLIRSVKKSVITDFDGNFIISRLEVGKYDVEVSAIGFDSKIVTDVEVIAGEVTNITISLVEKKSVLDEVVVTKTRAKAESIKSLLAVQKNSARVSDGISAESIKRTPDKTTSDVLKRISGASIQDNKFVIVRGLNDRYNTSFLNGSPLPSSEPDRKAFSFDIFPANMIDNLVIYKTATPDLPGEFAGGVIEINTKSVPDKDFQTLSIGAGYNTITTGKEQVYAYGGKSDWIGLDNGTRAFPVGFPSTKEFLALQNNQNTENSTKINDLSKNYITDWSLQNKTFLPNLNFQYTIGRKIKGGDGSDFGYLVSLSNSSTNNYNETRRKTYDPETVLERDLNEKKYSTQTLFGALANFSLKINPNNTFNLKNLYSINSDNRIVDQIGDLNQESEPLQTHSTARLFTSNTIYTGQLNGEHFLTKSKVKISWTSSYSKVTRDTPNDRRNNYTYIKKLDGTFTQPTAFFDTNPRNINNDSSGLFYSSSNKEDINSLKLDLSKKIKISEKISLEIKAGFFSQYRYRTFAARLLGYVPFKGTVNGVFYAGNAFDSSIPSLPENLIFTANTIGTISSNPIKSGLVLGEGTRPNDSYEASSKLNANYLMFDNIFGNIRFVWGARIESYHQDLDAKTDSGIPVFVRNNQIDFLPSANLIFSLNKKQNLRFSFSKTLNRPEFRELAPFLFFDFSTRQNTQGAPLDIAKINNYDFRYEIFPGKGQLFSVSAFYKEFDKPIELQALANNSNIYKNAKFAESRGIELEYRTLLSSIVGAKENKLLDDITLYTNVAIIRSKVDISNIATSDNLSDIPLQGQSPYVLNAGLQYINSEMGWSSALNFNRIGDRIAIQGNYTKDNTAPALWEKSRSFLDFQIAKSFLKNKLELKFNIQNILAEDLVFYSNNDIETAPKTGFDALINNVFTGTKQNKNGYDETIDDLVWVTKYGKTFSFTVTYNF